MIYPQMLMDLHGELIVDLFAGGGGASCGIEMALGRMVDVAVNHDPPAVAMHRANHPQTKHLTCDVFEVDPREVTGGRPVGLLWGSPDCTDHSKAKGGKPIRTRKRRALAWVLKRWAGTVRPRVIFLENVEEWTKWGPLVGPPDGLRRCGKRAGKTFRKFVADLRAMGYAVEWRERRACDSGAPTIRKRLYLIARCDGQPIVWPEPTHGPGRPLPWRTAAECIDFETLMLSVFATKEEAKEWGKIHGQAAPIRPLAEATMKRIARGVMRYVVNNPKPFLVTLNHGGGGEHAPRDTTEPFRTVTAARDAHALVSPVIAGVGGRMGQSPERPGNAPLQTVTGKADSVLVAPILADVAHGEVSPSGVKRWGTGARDIDQPLGTVTGSGNPAVVAPIIVPNNTNNVPTAGDAPVPTITGGGRNILAAPYLVPRYGERDGQQPRVRSVEEPAPVIVPTGNGGSLAAVHLASYHADKREGDVRGSGAGEPLDTIDTANRHAVVAAFLAQNNAGGYTGDGRPADEPVSTVLNSGSHQSLVAASMVKLRGTSTAAAADAPMHTASAEGQHHAVAAAHLTAFQTNDPYGGQGDPAEPARAVTGTSKAGLVFAFLQKYYGTGGDLCVGEPLHTIPTVDRFGLVTVMVDGAPMVVADIAMRMLQPRELYNAQGFPSSYVIDYGIDEHGRRVKLTKTEQVRMCGNSVCPTEAAALVRANCPDLIARDEVRAGQNESRRRRRERRRLLARQPDYHLGVEPAGEAA